MPSKTCSHCGKDRVRIADNNGNKFCSLNCLKAFKLKGKGTDKR